MSAVEYPRGTTLRSIYALLLRDMATANGWQFGGVLWSFVRPLAAIALMAVIFSAGFRTPPVGVNYAIFFASGVVPFGVAIALSNQLGNAIVQNRRLLRYPRIAVIDTVIARLIFVLLVQACVTVFVYSFVLTIYETKTTLVIERILWSLWLATVLGWGFGMWHAYMFTVVPTYRQVWSIASTPLFLLSCVIFPFEAVPQPFQDWLWYNPLVHVVGVSRTGFYPGYDAHYAEPLLPLLAGVTMGVLGMVLLSQERGKLLAR